jgi:D-alanyl-D-alanine carboxypeptidase/D-alanyl-D-alanine-endopeptidase (penicillin-binding protein 4)
VGGEGQGDLSETQGFTPASITKVITTAVAFKVLGPEFRFSTKVSWLTEDDGITARDLSVLADGDPLITRAKIKEIAVKLKGLGIKRLVGRLNLVSVDPRKDLFIPPQGLDKEDYFNCYGARVMNFNLNRNCSTIQVTAAPVARWTDSSVISPLRMETTRQNTSRLSFALEMDGPALRGYIIQSVPPKGSFAGLPVPDTKSWYGNVLAAELKAAGIDTSGAQSARDISQLPSNASFEINSPTLAELAKMTNKVSDNYLAEALYKASAVTGSGDINAAARAVTRTNIEGWLRDQGSADLSKELQLFDGAGLSRANKVTPRAFLTLLKAFTKESWFSALWDSLPIAGVDGTLRGRMTSGAAAKLVRAKTGTLKGAYQLAGYIPRVSSSGQILEYIPFVVLTATTPQNQGNARAFQDKLVSELTMQVNKRR